MIYIIFCIDLLYFFVFVLRFEVWNGAVQSLAVIDVLMSLAEYARKEEGEICIPVITEPSKCDKVREPKLQINMSKVFKFRGKMFPYNCICS